MQNMKKNILNAEKMPFLLRNNIIDEAIKCLFHFKIKLNVLIIFLL